MDWIIKLILLCSVLGDAHSFNVDPAGWKVFAKEAAGFGHQVVQRQKDVLISAPFQPYVENSTGQIYSCKEDCRNLPLPQPSNNSVPIISLGLAMTIDPTTQKTMVCAPTVPKDCKSITTYNGMCMEIDQNNKYGEPLPSSLDECRAPVDIVLLLDGSGSVSDQDFTTMKKFVKDMILSLNRIDTKFAVVQFSKETTIHYNFNMFNKSKNWMNDIDRIEQADGNTKTAGAIKDVVNQVYNEENGSRPSVKKILIIVTDGDPSDGDQLDESLKLAEEKHIERFAIGVGKELDNKKSKEVLKRLASDPSHMIKVDDFKALETIKESLQDKIFSIEGSKTSGEGLKLEMSQEGFRAVYVPGKIQMSTVGAYEWRGGYRSYMLQNGQIDSTYKPEISETDSYLGYSMVVVQTDYGLLTVLGGPRFKHSGVVLTVLQEKKKQQIYPSPNQTGQYFGAEVCAMDVDSDNRTDLILISAPMYKNKSTEGRVYVCDISVEIVEIKCHFDDFSYILTGEKSIQARFGSSLAVVPDLNVDGFNDLAVGAPLENDGQGCIYIFQGKAGGSKINPSYSQRIAASDIMSGLRYFGLSISQQSYDQSGDGLLDLAVGSKGKVVLLRSMPVMMVEPTVEFSLKEIKPRSDNCINPFESTATICFAMSNKSNVKTATAVIGYTLALDVYKNQNHRAYGDNKNQKQLTGSVTVQLGEKKCTTVNFNIQACPEDSLNPIENRLNFTFKGLPSGANLCSSLSQQAQTQTFHPIQFEISCGQDKECTDNLQISLNSPSVVKIGTDKLLNVSVTVENKGEDSYNSRIILTYPFGLSYMKVTALQGRIECQPSDSEDPNTKGKTSCRVDKPIFKAGSKAVFIVSYGFGFDTRPLSKRNITITAKATSSSSYNNFTYGKKQMQKPFKQLIKVSNNRDLNFTVVIEVPIKIGEKNIWSSSDSLKIPGCAKAPEEIRESKIDQNKDFVAEIKKTTILDCSVALCHVFKCNLYMKKRSNKTLELTSNLSSGWIEQIGLSSAKFLLTSNVRLEYDEEQYAFFSTTSNNTRPVFKIKAEVEVLDEPNFIKEIIGGTVGGLLFLILLTVCLYKAGFFKSKYKEMMNEGGGETGI